MIIRLVPQRDHTALAVALAGDVLLLNGAAFDFGPLPDGSTLPAEAIDSDWIIGPVERIDGELHFTLRLPHGPNPSRAVAFPEPIRVMVDGLVDLPSDADSDEISQ
ncbi:hypothetical protein DN824_20445 [Stutzerimonas nosocomialis]|uniref:hypothetical protein n=1 Tax=Stutzerimonas nosocomialis TaxID=1056496 RepID=UPI001109336B|nr:hypothetical protein [Stutzerimonas nosocomialis]TLX54855.1 hypothetical protein DN824_20445 [Stutzerimonas nosocomialis]